MNDSDLAVSTADTIHPLDPLSPAEIRAAVEPVRAKLKAEGRLLFADVSLVEPAKSEVRAYRAGKPLPRRARLMVLQRDVQRTLDVLVDLGSGAILRCEEVPGVQPPVLFTELEELGAVVRAHAGVREGLARRGITDPEKVHAEFFANGNFGAAEDGSRRLLRPHLYYAEEDGDNPYVRPVDGLVPVIDLNTMEVVRVEDFGVKPLPPDIGDYTAARMKNLQPPLAELDIRQPAGPDFQVDGWLVRWRNWSFRIGFTAREGLVLHCLHWTDRGRERPVVYRASVSELVVPYAETVNDQFRNHSFDMGEGTFGHCVNALELGCDCVGEIRYFDVHLADDHGDVIRYPNAICMHEEDYGVLWKHQDPLTGETELRRSRRLVVSSFFTVGNYDYGFFWYLYLDGTIAFEAKLTGMLLCRAVEDGEDIPYGRLVAPNLNAMIHEHYFNLRLDMSVDGDDNAVYEVEAERFPTGPDNPHGNAHGARETLIENERQAGRDINPGNGRYWKVVNRSRRNALGWHPGYKLVPGPNVRPMHLEGSPFLRRAGFVAHDLWVTAFDFEQLFAPGRYINQNPDCDGIDSWVKAERPLADQDIVLWHTLGVLHVPRPEDFPVMPVEYVGFHLKPVGFFERNPSLELAPPGCHHRESMD